MAGFNGAHTVKVKSSMARNLPVGNLYYYKMCCQLTTICSNATEVAKMHLGLK